MEQLVLRCKKYPKKGSNEWIISDDSIECRMIEKEQKNRTFSILDVAEVKLKDSYLELKIDVDGKRVGQPIIFFAPEDVATAQQIHDYILERKPEPEMSEADRKRLAQNEKRIKLGDEHIKLNEQLVTALNLLETKINRNVFTEPEMQEIAEIKKRGIDLGNQNIELTERSTKLLLQQASLLKRGIRDGKVTELDEQIYDLDEQIWALDAESVTQLETLKKLVEIGQSREMDCGLYVSE
jgi:hypothetical protein